MSSTIDELRALREQYKAEGKTGGGDNTQLFFKAEDKAFGYLLWDGIQPQGQTFMYYLGHGYPATQGRQWGDTKPCLASLFGPNADCPGCKAGYKTKEQMAMYIYTWLVMRNKLREGDSLPLTNVLGQTGYMQEVNDVKLWVTSAWKDSPFEDLLQQAKLLSAAGQSLHSGMWQISATGDGRTRRYKMFMVPGQAALDPNAMAQLIAGVEPIKDVIARMVTPTAAAPAGAPEYRMENGRLVQVTPTAAAPAQGFVPPPPATAMTPPAYAAPPAPPPVAVVPAPPAPAAPAAPAPPIAMAPPAPPVAVAPASPEPAPVAAMPEDLPDDDGLMAAAAAEVQAAPMPPVAPAPPAASAAVRPKSLF